jgi:hypothetical protein
MKRAGAAAVGRLVHRRRRRRALGLPNPPLVAVRIFLFDRILSLYSKLVLKSDPHITWNGVTSQISRMCVRAWAVFDRAHVDGVFPPLQRLFALSTHPPTPTHPRRGSAVQPADVVCLELLFAAAVLALLPRCRSANLASLCCGLLAMSSVLHAWAGSSRRLRLFSTGLPTPRTVDVLVSQKKIPASRACKCNPCPCREYYARWWSNWAARGCCTTRSARRGTWK